MLGVDGGEFQDIEYDIEQEEYEVRDVVPLRDPGAPTAEDVEKHNLTHMRFRAWCPDCVNGKAKDRHHHKRDEDGKQVPQIVFDYGFLGDTDDAETVAIQIAKDRRTKMFFAHVVP